MGNRSPTVGVDLDRLERLGTHDREEGHSSVKLHNREEGHSSVMLAINQGCSWFRQSTRTRVSSPEIVFEKSHRRPRIDLSLTSFPFLVTSDRLGKPYPTDRAPAVLVSCTLVHRMMRPVTKGIRWNVGKENSARNSPMLAALSSTPRIPFRSGFLPPMNI